MVAPDFREISPEDAIGRDGRRRLVRTLGIATLQFRVDPNRIFLVGIGAHGPTAARFAALQPHFYSAVAAVGGEADAGRAAPNLAMVNHSTQDDLAAAAAWLLEQPARSAYPSAIDFTLTEPWAGRAFWVQATRFDQSGITAEDAGDASSFKVAVDAATNTIRIDGKGVYQVILYLNDRIVDLDKTVHIVRNGVEYQYTPNRSLGILLQNFATSVDAGAVFPATVQQVDLPEPE